jgi:translation initiation factor RLI1
VRQLLHERIQESYQHPQFITDVMKPMMIEQLMDQEVHACPSADAHTRVRAGAKLVRW